MPPDEDGTEPGVVTKLSPKSVLDTSTLLANLILARGLKLFAVVDQSAEARSAGLPLLPDTTLVIFGDPLKDTPAIADSRFAALDVPYRALVWADGAQTKVSYYAPATLAARHHLSTGLAARLSSIDSLTDAVTAP